MKYHAGLWRTVLFALFSFLPAQITAAELPVLVLNDTNEPPLTTPEHDGFLDLVVGEAFRRTGHELRLIKLPAERALLNADAGIEDGDLTRIMGMERLYPNLVRVPEKLVDWEFTAFAKDASIPAHWDSIIRHTVGHIKGWKIYEKQLQGVKNVITAEDPEQLFRLLEADRIHIALYMRWMGLALIRQKEWHNVHALEPTLATREMFIYLNKRHHELIPKLAAALRAIKDEGLYERWFREKVLLYTESVVE